MQSLGLAADLMARRPGLDEEMSMLVETVGQDAARLRTVARQFMEIARMSPSALQLVPDTVDLVERVREWLIPFQLVARESGERLLLSMPETDIPVTIDTERFAWVDVYKRQPPNSSLYSSSKSSKDKRTGFPFAAPAPAWTSEGIISETSLNPSRVYEISTGRPFCQNRQITGYVSSGFLITSQTCLLYTSRCV